MFTGIVEEVGTTTAVFPHVVTISAHKVIEGTNEGDSIAVNGACLTVTHISPTSFSVDIMPETLRRTNLGRLKPGDSVNLERALALGGRIGGHLVQGHIDDTGRVTAATREADAILLTVEASPGVVRYVVSKGFIAVDGVSLTVVQCTHSCFVVSLVRYTQKGTNLSDRRPGDVVNLEVDIIAKYVEQLLRGGTGSTITEEFLAEHGFLSMP